jgi:hypothetical protein
LRSSRCCCPAVRRSRPELGPGTSRGRRRQSKAMELDVSCRTRARGQAPWSVIPCSAAAGEREAEAELLALTGLQPFLVSSLAVPPPRRPRWPLLRRASRRCPRKPWPLLHRAGCSRPCTPWELLLRPSLQHGHPLRCCPQVLLPFQSGSTVRLRPPRARLSTMVRSPSINCKETSSVSVQLNSACKIAATQ